MCYTGWTALLLVVKGAKHDVKDNTELKLIIDSNWPLLPSCIISPQIKHLKPYLEIIVGKASELTKIEY